MKISKLTIVSGVIFLSLLLYKFLAPKGLCQEIDLFLCNFYMEGIVRIAYLFAAMTITSYCIENCFKKYQKQWWKFARFALPVAIFLLILINYGILHQDKSNGSGFGWVGILDNFLDKMATIAVYAFFIIGSAITIYKAHRQSEKPNAKK